MYKSLTTKCDLSTSWWLNEANLSDCLVCKALKNVVTDCLTCKDSDLTCKDSEVKNVRDWIWDVLTTEYECIISEVDDVAEDVEDILTADLRCSINVEDVLT